LIVAAARTPIGAAALLGSRERVGRPGRYGNDQYDRMCRMNRKATQELS